MNRSHHVHTAKLTLFMVSKDEWDTKEGTGKSMKSTFYEQQLVYSRDIVGVGVAHNIKPALIFQMMIRQYWLVKTKPEQAFRLIRNIF